MIEKAHPTLLIDEADSFLKDNEDSRGILNSGNTREAAFVIRTQGEDHEPVQFSTWAAKALACIGKLPETLTDRSISIMMRRKAPTETREKLRAFNHPVLQQKLMRWAQDNADAVAKARPVDLPAMNDRAEDCWLPLLAIADVAGGEWAASARKAAAAMSGEEDDSLGVKLLSDICSVFQKKKTDRIFTKDLIEELAKMDERPWEEFNSKKRDEEKWITPRQISNQMKPFGITRRDIRDGTEHGKGYHGKGYHGDDFTDALRRYAPDHPFLSVTG